MIKENIRQHLNDMGLDESLLFDNPSFDDAIIGYTSDERVVYDYDKMVESYAKEFEVEPIDAADFISYNTVRALPYAGDKAPIILYTFEQDDF